MSPFIRISLSVDIFSLNSLIPSKMTDESDETWSDDDDGEDESRVIRPSQSPIGEDDLARK